MRQVSTIPAKKRILRIHSTHNLLSYSSATAKTLSFLTKFMLKVPLSSVDLNWIGRNLSQWIQVSSIDLHLSNLFQVTHMGVSAPHIQATLSQTWSKMDQRNLQQCMPSVSSETLLGLWLMVFLSSNAIVTLLR